MALKMFVLAAVLGLTFLHSTFGLYSGLINVLCCVTALCVSLGFSEVLTDVVTSNFGGLSATYAAPGVTFLLFVITLALLRYLADHYLRGNVRLPMYVDWAGGAVCGFVIADICVGVLVVSFLGLPWGDRVATFSRYERDEDETVDPVTNRVEFVRSDLWLTPDGFACGLFNMLSKGSLKGGTTFETVYPDYPEWVFWSGNNIQHESQTAPARHDNHDGFGTKGLRVERWWEQTRPITAADAQYRPSAPTRRRDNPSYEPMAYTLASNVDNKLLGFRLALRGDAADWQKKTSAHRFRPSMIRLVGDVPGPAGAVEPQHYIAQLLGGADPAVGTDLRIVEVDNNFSLGGGDQTIDAYFEVPKDFRPRFVEYRRFARSPVEEAARTDTAPTDRLVAPPTDTGRGGRRSRTRASAAGATGASRFIDTVDQQFTGDRDELPFAMSSASLRGQGVTVLNGLLVSGRIATDRSALTGGGSEVVKFQIPTGKRLFQLQTKPRKARSLPGEVLNFAGSITNQYFAVDEDGTRYELAGYYAIVPRGGDQYVELFFSPDPVGEGFRGMLDFRDDGLRRELQDQDEASLGLLFLVPPGKKIVSVQNQGGGGVDFGGQSYAMGT